MYSMIHFIKNVPTYVCTCVYAKKKDWKERYQNISSGDITSGFHFIL